MLLVFVSNFDDTGDTAINASYKQELKVSRRGRYQHKLYTDVRLFYPTGFVLIRQHNRPRAELDCIFPNLQQPSRGSDPRGSF